MRAKGAICGAAHVVSSAREKGTVRWRRESSVMKASAELPRAPMVETTKGTSRMRGGRAPAPPYCAMGLALTLRMSRQADAIGVMRGNKVRPQRIQGLYVNERKR